jgi:hypothetical protein
MWHKAQDQPSQSGVGRTHLLGRSARCWRHFNFHFANVSRRVGARGIRCPKLVEAELGGRPANQGLVSYHLKSMVELTHSTYKYPHTPFGEIEIRK